MSHKFLTGAENMRKINQRWFYQVVSNKCAMSERKILNVAQMSVKFFIDMFKKNPRNERKSDKKAEEESSSY